MRFIVVENHKMSVIERKSESESESAEVTMLAPSCPTNFTYCLLAPPTVTLTLTKPMTASYVSAGSATN
jgi:hypothetical protein